ncbi:uncharacterized protein G2W53_035732 [Senna tora]|uniref:Uncharacterized protein n=1 Tax=Senna tora TaxID=362788 RepID=A0A834SSA3_9FABA|nr:uncharacterized protein G2W53_035732 [Senna tora]
MVIDITQVSSLGLNSTGGGRLDQQVEI